MQNKLLLSLWLLGGALYLGGTIFFAHAILGAGSRTTELTANKGLTTTAAIAAPETQCPPASAAAAETPVPAQGEAKAAENGTADAASEPKEPVRTAAVGQEAEETTDGDSAPQLPTADAGAQPTGDADSPDGRGLGEAATPEADHQGQAEWAQVVATAADVHAQPSAEAPSIYALPAGRQVRVLTHENGWTQVQDVASGGTGWVEARALAPIGAPGGQDRGYGNQYDDAYADDNDQDDWRWRRRHRQGGIGDFVRRALGGGW
jgi:lipoprotein-anchoring transpeptidase ErfK/SrfK